MSERLLQEVAERAAPAHRLNAVKEFLQEVTLGELARQQLLADLVFQGGTALRLIHGLRRYSEDLDFIYLAGGSFDDVPLRAALVRVWSPYGLFAQLSVNRYEVANAPGKFILRLGLAALLPEKLKTSLRANQMQITFEIDLNPPGNIQTEVRPTRTRAQVPVLTLPSLMSGKLHILLSRPDREKGRDWYDYAWYRRQGIEPHIPQLDQALRQTGCVVDAAKWFAALKPLIEARDWPRLREDVRPFLERPAEVDELNAARMLELTPSA